MVRVLCSSISGAGHFTPLIPFIRSFLRAGHDVMVAGPPALVSSAVGTGEVFWPFDKPPRDEMTSVAGSLSLLSPEEANALVCREIFGRLNATAAMPRLREALDEWRPDLVLRESGEFGSAVAAELHGVPHARLAVGLGAAEDYIAGYVMESVEKLRSDHGLRRDPERRWLHAAPQLTLFPNGLEDPASSTAAVSRFRDPAWDAFAGRDVDATEFGTPPPNVRVVAWIDQIDVLGEATAVICHGGGGSTLGALAAIRDALQAVLAGGRFRVAAEVLAAELAAQPSTDDALDVLT